MVKTTEVCYAQTCKIVMLNPCTHLGWNQILELNIEYWCWLHHRCQCSLNKVHPINYWRAIVYPIKVFKKSKRGHNHINLWVIFTDTSSRIALDNEYKCSIVPLGLIVSLVVSYPDPFVSHTGKGSGETRIQFWFHVARSGRSQLDCRLVSTSRSCLKKDCNSNLKEPREGWLPFVYQAIDEVTCRFNSAKAWARREALLYVSEL